MFEFIRNHQMNIMLALCAMCAMMAILLLLTEFLPKKRKWILISMEIVATLLLFFDRLAYIYSGDLSPLAYVMVRLSNFMVFFLTPGVVLGLNFYLADLLERVGVKKIPRRLTVVGIACLIEMLMVVANLFTGFYFFFDDSNCYHRGSGFLFCYLVPVIGPLIQFSVIQKYRKSFSRYIYIVLTLYIFVPIVVGIIQIFTYGISIVNMAMVMVSVSMYIFTYLDINDNVQKAHSLEMKALLEEQNNIRTLFGQTVTAFIKAVEKRNSLLSGKSEKIAFIAKAIAQKSGMSQDDCDKVYYAALLHKVAIATFSDSILDKDVFAEEDQIILKKLPLESSEILSEIKKYPYLSETAGAWTERYDGKGFPRGLKGEEIPVYARIIAIANAYTKLSSRTKYRNPVPMAVIREEFVKEAGGKYDPYFANIMTQLMDLGQSGPIEEENYTVETELTCGEYRDKVSVGIPILQNEVCVTMKFSTAPDLKEGQFSAPSIVLFDSFDRRAHTDEKSIETYRYIEYGELWFDGHSISTNVRNMEIQVVECSEGTALEDGLYKITAGHFEDHLKLCLASGSKLVNVIIALPDIARSAYFGLTGEHCSLFDIQIDYTDKFLEEKDIPRIADQISFINRIEADVPNVQINSTLSAYTKGILIKENLSVVFHTMSFPDSSFVWHCPYIVIFYSETGNVGGKGYKEYALVKLNGEDNGSNSYAENHFSVRKASDFKGWDYWKNENKSGIECVIDFQKQENTVTFTTKNLGIEIENTTILRDAPKEVYVALTGDECAITDIRLR